MEPKFIANPHALINNNVCTEVIFMQNYSAEEISEKLLKYTYDEVVLWENYGQEILIGFIKLGDDFFPPKPYPSWLPNLHPELGNSWESPKPAPFSQGADGIPEEYVWNEELLEWVLSS